MTADDARIRRMRAMLGASAARAVPGADCPDPDDLWAARRGELSVTDAECIADHLACCASCREAWRVAGVVGDEPAELRPAPETRGMQAKPMRWRPALMALAAAALVIVGVASTLFIQSVVNIGVTLGLSPVTGMPLPLLSYGGSSLLVTLLSIGIVLGMSMRRMEY